MHFFDVFSGHDSQYLRWDINLHQAAKDAEENALREGDITKNVTSDAFAATLFDRLASIGRLWGNLDSIFDSDVYK